jgi:hypothetical protein
MVTFEVQEILGKKWTEPDYGSTRIGLLQVSYSFFQPLPFTGSNVGLIIPSSVYKYDPWVEDSL